MIKKCVICGREFGTNMSRQITCSPLCSKENKRRKHIANYYRRAKKEPKKPLQSAKSMKSETTLVLGKTHCYHCDKLFDRTFPNEKFCSDNCRIDYFGLGVGYNTGYFFLKFLRQQKKREVTT